MAAVEGAAGIRRGRNVLRVLRQVREIKLHGASTRLSLQKSSKRTVGNFQIDLRLRSRRKVIARPGKRELVETWQLYPSFAGADFKTGSSWLTPIGALPWVPEGRFWKRGSLCSSTRLNSSGGSVEIWVSSCEVGGRGSS